MTLKIKYSIARKVSIALACIMLAESALPTAALALTSGPAQPEFSSFEPVATTNMVNEFSGDLTYNLPVIEIPGANGGGYALSLSYHSGASAEEEASWVGYGWTLNPGSISRGKRGFPDDDKGTSVKFWNQTPANKTITVGAGAGAEAFSRDLPLNLNYSLRYNNYKGFGTTYGAGLQLAKGLISLGYSVSDGEGSFSVRVNPMAILTQSLKAHAKADNDQSKKASDPKDKEIKRKASNRSALEHLAANATKGLGALNLVGSNYGLCSHSESVRNVNITQYTGASVNFTASAQFTPAFPQAGVNVDLQGNYSYQENVPNTSLPVYGYMYSGSALSSSTAMMDYYMEKLNPYDKQDKHLGIPFSNADIFSLSGEGIGGSFRAYHREAGTFRPNAVTSQVQILNAGAEGEAGFNIGGGMDLGVGFQKFSSTNWPISSPASSDFSNSSGDEPYLFRFTNDLGGSINYGSDSKQQANVTYAGGGKGNKSFNANISQIGTTLNSDSRPGRSSYVAYHTNSEMSLTKNSKRYKAYCVSDTINRWVNRSSGGHLSDGIGEFAVYNEDGTRYTYGLPVYSRNELNMQYDLQGVSAGAVFNNYIAYKDISNNKSQVGEDRAKPYAASYLLTEIVSPDYLDRTMDGPTDDDFGGYTKFTYNRLYGSYSKDSSNITWYRWRTPYTGLLYNRGDLSTWADDMGSVSCGEKEVYYLDRIETKTHVAIFRTSDRLDGRDAKDNLSAASNSSVTISSQKTLKKLDRIDIYSKNSGSPQLIKSVRFAYDYSLCTGTPNSSSGKLTLKKVWFEYQGIYNAKISPYIFQYTYPTVPYPEKYPLLDSLGIRPSPDLTENPSYSAFSIDAWGNYQDGGATRFANMQHWVDQTPPNTFDPAAWQLKAVQLPSGGEIHIQYEQDDYKYVQDKWAHAMVSLDAATDDSDNNTYYLAVAGDLGSAADTAQLRKLINDQYVATGNKMYFKFLYRLLADGPPSTEPSLSSCSSDYIKGYCTVKKVGRNPSNGKIYVTLGSRTGKFNVPKKVCYNYVKTQRSGMISAGNNCDPSANGIQMNGSAKNIVMSLVSKLPPNDLFPKDGKMCVRINPSLSYLRIPVPFSGSGIKGKKGGGLRVKRLLMYDKGIESGDKSLFGNEYVYELSDGTSSGVATNEPSAIREENALVEFDPKDKQSFLDKIVAGRDKEQSEKPLGESILPSPSVGYSRVVIKNIFTGTTNTGFTVKEFYTAKDYPVKVDYTPIETQRDYLPVPGGLINYFVSNLWLSQGFTFYQNNMHGQPRSETTYRGDYSDMANASMGSQQVFTYFQPGTPSQAADQIPVMNSLNNMTYTNPGKETELVFETRGAEDISNDIAIEIDLDIGLAFIPIPFFSLVPSYTYNESKMYSHTTTKIVNYPAIQKSVLSYADGIYHLSENLAFNPSTGKPVVVRTTDGFDKTNLQLSSAHKGNYEAYTIPASQQYAAMGQKAKDERLVINTGTNLTITCNGTGNPYSLSFTGSNGCVVPNQLCPGSMIMVRSATTSDSAIFHVSDSLVGNMLFMYNAVNYQPASPSNLDGKKVNIQVLRSGCTNQLNAVTGGFTTYGDTASSVTSGYQNISDRIWLRDTLNTLMGLIDCSSNPSVTLPRNKIKRSLMALGGASCDSLRSVTLSCDGFCYSITDTLKNGATTYMCSSGLYCDYPICFALDENYKLVYFPGSTCPVSCSATTSGGTSVPCLDLCPVITDDVKKVNVITASAQTYSDLWGYDGNVYPVVTYSNNYENGTKGKWRHQSSYVYRDTVIGANASNQRIYKDAGVFTLQTFNWKKTDQNDTAKWIKVNTVTRYSPDGNATEEKDIMGIYSAAKFGYDHTQPYLIAKNSDYQSVQYDGFEKAYSSNTALEDGWSPSGISTNRTNTYAHSGQYSWKLTSAANVALKNLSLTQQIKNNGLILKVWAKDTAVSPQTAITTTFVINGTNVTNTTTTKVARTGEWTLYQCVLDASYFSSYGVGVTISPKFVNTYSSKAIWIDDIRYEPADAQMIAYVYDINTLRLITTFDDQHFGLFYQYNSEGKLVRKQKETVKGTKTITETQYHTPGVLR